MHAYRDINEALDAKCLVETIIKKAGWLPIEVFNKLFDVKPGKPLPKDLGWDKTAIGYEGDSDEGDFIRIKQRYWLDGKYELIMPRPIRRHYRPNRR